MTNNSTTEIPAKEINLHDEKKMKQLLDWYDQQIAVAGKNKELSELNAAIAKARAEEVFAFVQMARMSAGNSGGQNKEEEGA